MKQELIQSFVVWCEETATKLELELLTVDDGIVESAWCEETNKRVDVIRPAMNIRAEFRRRLKEIDPLMLHSRELFWPTDLVALAFGPSTRERLRKAAALVGRLASEVTRQQVEIAVAPVPSEPVATLPPEARAILFVNDRLKVTGKLPTQTAIAKALDVAPRTLRNWKAFQTAYKAAKAREQRPLPPKGSKSSDGTIEAADEGQ